MHLGINDNRQEDDGLENGKKIDNYYYNFNDVIGKGNFSQVFRGFDHTTNKYVAIKVVNFSSFTSTVAEQLLKNEVNIWYLNLLSFTCINTPFLLSRLSIIKIKSITSTNIQIRYFTLI
jgi:serine/threonine protein kinase